MNPSRAARLRQSTLWPHPCFALAVFVGTAAQARMGAGTAGDRNDNEEHACRDPVQVAARISSPEADASFKATMTQPMLDSFSAQFAPRLNQGYIATFLARLNQGGYSNLPVEARIQGRRGRQARHHGGQGRQGQRLLFALAGLAARFKPERANHETSRRSNGMRSNLAAVVSGRCRRSGSEGSPTAVRRGRAPAAVTPAPAAPAPAAVRRDPSGCIAAGDARQETILDASRRARLPRVPYQLADHPLCGEVSLYAGAPRSRNPKGHCAAPLRLRHGSRCDRRYFGPRRSRMRQGEGAYSRPCSNCRRGRARATRRRRGGPQNARTCGAAGTGATRGGAGSDSMIAWPVRTCDYAKQLQFEQHMRDVLLDPASMQIRQPAAQHRRHGAVRRGQRQEQTGRIRRDSGARS